MYKTNKHLSEYWKNELPETESEAFKKKYSNALIRVIYVDGLSLNKRISASSPLFKSLIELPEGEVGTKLMGEKHLSDKIVEVRIRRTSIAGPVVDVDSLGRLGNPVRNALLKKFAKNIDVIAQLNYWRT